MKRNLLILSLFVLFSHLSLAQSKIRMGFVAGVNYADYGSINGVNMDSKIAFLAGLNSEIKLNDKLFFTADLCFERKRAESKVFGQDMISGRKLYLIAQNDYLILPIKLKYDFKKLDSFYLTGGIYAAYLVNSYYYDGFVGSESPNRFKKMDYGFCFGIGKAFNITPTSRINLELRESIGLADISDNKWYYGGGSIGINSTSLICSYSFDLK